MLSPWQQSANLSVEGKTEREKVFTEGSGDYLRSQSSLRRDRDVQVDMLRVGYHSYVYKLSCETQVQPEPPEKGLNKFTLVPEIHHQSVRLCMTGRGREWCPVRVKGGPEGHAACRERTEPHAHHRPQTPLTGRPPASICRYCMQNQHHMSKSVRSHQKICIPICR